MAAVAAVVVTATMVAGEVQSGLARRFTASILITNRGVPRQSIDQFRNAASSSNIDRLEHSSYATFGPISRFTFSALLLPLVP